MRQAKEKQDELEEPINMNLLDEEKDLKKKVNTKIKYNYKWLQQYEQEK